MKLHEIISHFDSGTIAVEWEHVRKYRRSLLAYYRDMYNGEPIFMVVSVTNNSCYGIVVPANDFPDALDTWMAASGTKRDSEDWENECELINFNSKFLNK